MFGLLSNLVDFSDDLFDVDDDFHHDFGFGVYPRELTYARRRPPYVLALPRSSPRHQPYELSKRREGRRSSRKELCTGKDGFQVCIDVQNFKPNELTVKTVDNTVIIEGKHEEKEDEHGFISRHFVRKYTLPEGYDPNQVASTLSSDGVLTIKAPPPAKALEGNERVVQIHETGPAHLSVKDNAQEEEKEKSQKKDNKGKKSK